MGDKKKTKHPNRHALPTRRGRQRQEQESIRDEEEHYKKNGQGKTVSKLPPTAALQLPYVDTCSMEDEEEMFRKVKPQLEDEKCLKVMLTHGQVYILTNVRKKLLQSKASPQVTEPKVIIDHTLSGLSSFLSPRRTRSTNRSDHGGSNGSTIATKTYDCDENLLCDFILLSWNEQGIPNMTNGQLEEMVTRLPLWMHIKCLLIEPNDDKNEGGHSLWNTVNGTDNDNDEKKNTTKSTPTKGRTTSCRGATTMTRNRSEVGAQFPNLISLISSWKQIEKSKETQRKPDKQRKGQKQQKRQQTGENLLRFETYPIKATFSKPVDQRLGYQCQLFLARTVLYWKLHQNLNDFGQEAEVEEQQQKRQRTKKNGTTKTRNDDSSNVEEKKDDGEKYQMNKMKTNKNNTKKNNIWESLSQTHVSLCKSYLQYLEENLAKNLSTSKNGSINKKQRRQQQKPILLIQKICFDTKKVLAEYRHKEHACHSLFQSAADTEEQFMTGLNEALDGKNMIKFNGFGWRYREWVPVSTLTSSSSSPSLPSLPPLPNDHDDDNTYKDYENGDNVIADNETEKEGEEMEEQSSKQIKKRGRPPKNRDESVDQLCLEASENTKTSSSVGEACKPKSSSSSSSSSTGRKKINNDNKLIGAAGGAAVGAAVVTPVRTRATKYTQNVQKVGNKKVDETEVESLPTGYADDQQRRILKLCQKSGAILDVFSSPIEAIKNIGKDTNDPNLGFYNALEGKSKCRDRHWWQGFCWMYDTSTESTTHQDATTTTTKAIETTTETTTDRPQARGKVNDSPVVDDTLKNTTSVNKNRTKEIDLSEDEIVSLDGNKDDKNKNNNKDDNSSNNNNNNDAEKKNDEIEEEYRNDDKIDDGDSRRTKEKQSSLPEQVKGGEAKLIEKVCLRTGEVLGVYETPETAYRSVGGTSIRCKAVLCRVLNGNAKSFMGYGFRYKGKTTYQTTTKKEVAINGTKTGDNDRYDQGNENDRKNIHLRRTREGHSKKSGPRKGFSSSTGRDDRDDDGDADVRSVEFSSEVESEAPLRRVQQDDRARRRAGTFKPKKRKRSSRPNYDKRGHRKRRRRSQNRHQYYVDDYDYGKNHSENDYDSYDEESWSDEDSYTDDSSFCSTNSSALEDSAPFQRKSSRHRRDKIVAAGMEREELRHRRHRRDSIRSDEDNDGDVVSHGRMMTSRRREKSSGNSSTKKNCRGSFPHHRRNRQNYGPDDSDDDDSFGTEDSYYDGDLVAPAHRRERDDAITHKRRRKKKYMGSGSRKGRLLTKGAKQRSRSMRSRRRRRRSSRYYDSDDDPDSASSTEEYDERKNHARQRRRANKHGVRSRKNGVRDTVERFDDDYDDSDGSDQGDESPEQDDLNRRMLTNDTGSTKKKKQRRSKKRKRTENGYSETGRRRGRRDRANKYDDDEEKEQGHDYDYGSDEYVRENQSSSDFEGDDDGDDDFEDDYEVEKSRRRRRRRRKHPEDYHRERHHYKAAKRSTPATASTAEKRRTSQPPRGKRYRREHANNSSNKKREEEDDSYGILGNGEENGNSNAGPNRQDRKRYKHGRVFKNKRHSSRGGKTRQQEKDNDNDDIDRNDDEGNNEEQRQRNNQHNTSNGNVHNDAYEEMGYDDELCVEI